MKAAAANLREMDRLISGERAELTDGTREPDGSRPMKRLPVCPLIVAGTSIPASR
jgi:hypothetical protein